MSMDPLRDAAMDVGAEVVAVGAAAAAAWARARRDSSSAMRAWTKGGWGV